MHCLLFSLCLLAAAVGGGLSESEQSQLSEIRATLRSAGVAFRDEKFEAAESRLEAAKKQLDDLPENDEVQKAVASLRKSWAKADRLVAQKLQETDIKLRAVQPIRFISELAPQIVARCTGCHGDNRARQDLRLHTFAGVMKGSESGDVVDLSDAESSLILLKMKGEGGDDRMPPNGRPMSDEWIAKFQRWIDEGAKYDGQNPSATLKQEILASRRNTLSSDELTKSAEEMARKNWNLAFPDREIKIQSANSLIVVSTANAPDYTKLAKQAESTLVDVIRLLGLPKDAQVKGSLTLYIIPRRYDYAEWSQMVENRTSPSTQPMQWHNSGGLGYVVLGPNSLSEKNVVVDEKRLTQMLTSALLGQWGAPTWYAEGRGLLTRGQTNRRDAQTKKWKATATSVLPKIKRSKDIFEALLPAAEADSASWAFAAFLGSDRKRSTRLHTTLRAGQAFDLAFASAYGKPPALVCDDWLKTFKYAKKKRRQ